MDTLDFPNYPEGLLSDDKTREHYAKAVAYSKFAVQSATKENVNENELLAGLVTASTYDEIPLDKTPVEYLKMAISHTDQLLDRINKEDYQKFVSRIERVRRRLREQKSELDEFNGSIK